MNYDFRAFGETVKTILVDGDVADLTALPQTLSTSSDGFFPTQYNMMHIVTLEDSVIVVTLKNDIGAAGTYTLTLVGQVQVAGVSSITVTSGKVEVLFLA